MNYIKSSVNLTTGTIEEKREEIKKQFLQTYEFDEKLFDLLKDKKYLYEQPNSLRHPLIFYYGHTATFFINKLILAKRSKAKKKTKQLEDTYSTIIKKVIRLVQWKKSF